MEVLAEAYDSNLLSSSLNRDPLMFSATTGNIALLRRIIATGVNLNRGKYDACAFNLACTSDSFQSTDDQLMFLDLLMENGAKHNFSRQYRYIKFTFIKM